MLKTTLNQQALARHFREYDADMIIAERISEAEELYWKWRNAFEEELENDDEIEEFYLELDEMDNILSAVKSGFATVKDMAEFLLSGDNSFRMDREVREYVC